MIYKQVIPHHALADYIDCYWSIEGAGGELHTERIFPDGSPGLVLNVGEKCTTDNGLVIMQPGSCYLVGAMTSYKETYLNGRHRLIGVCFKPGAFSQFYNYMPLAEITEQTVELEKALAPDTGKIEALSFTALNTFFLKRLSVPKQELSAIINCIKETKGKISVVALAKKTHVTPRQLERIFHKHIGVTPKEFISITRFQHVLPDIIHNKKHKSLLDIAIEHGYYDHAHLTNEIKRYTSLPPSGL
ncbi:MAG TPA: helix-turn-helix domain-containing protein [Chitinophaga sp.]|uniref:AraC family transcriptional regulator n=1 Tax=Chitinophaga sp. TaxID=1869181 RepID=UPI002B53DFE1|nr:helix-turn-helix domain-containing protein [Chitinophaga sp.]HVI49269.1 helix-turn-helix domain-containing protein [Chitinophaga sp.]